MKKPTIALSVAILAFWVQPAMAYIDPGSGSAIISALIGFFVALSLGIKTYWYKLKGLFTKKKENPETNPDSEDLE